MTKNSLTIVSIFFFTVTVISLPADAGKLNGKLKGNVVYSGVMTAPKKIVATTDTAICSQQDLVDESLIVDQASKGIASVIVWIPNSRQANPKKKERLLDNYRCRYEPHVVILRAGQDLKIRNRDRFLHTSQAMLGDRTKFNIALPTRNQMTKKKLTKPGFYSVHCDVHDWMKAWVAVFKNEVVGLTGKEGGFELSGLPTGRQKLELWHETLGRKTIQVNIEATANQSLAIKW